MKPLQIPIEHKPFANGLRVVVAPDSTAPVVTVGVYYKIGFRLEPRGRSGFAHLFEHMMFQGSENAPKMQHIKLVNSSGGVLNGSTMYDVTNYFEAVPSNALERMLWLEADRMRALVGNLDPNSWTGQVSPRYFYGFPKPTIVNAGKNESASATPVHKTIRPVRNSWITSVSVFTSRSTVAKNAVCAPRSLKLWLTIPACWKYRTVEVIANSSRNRLTLTR